MNTREVSKKLSTRELTDSRMLMIMISAGPSHGSKTVERVLATVDEELKAKKNEPGGEHLPVYDVRVSVNGVELDFREFTAEVTRQLDDMVMREAGKLLKDLIGDKLGTLIEDAYQNLEKLNRGIRQKATELLGYNPWRDE